MSRLAKKVLLINFSLPSIPLRHRPTALQAIHHRSHQVDHRGRRLLALVPTRRTSGFDRGYGGAHLVHDESGGLVR